MRERIQDYATISEGIGKILKLFSTVSIVLGALITIIYCSQMHFYPTGLTTGDVFFFIAVILTVGFYYSVLTLFLFGVAIGITTIFRRPLNWLISKLEKHIYKRGEAALPRFPDQKDARLAVICGGILCNIILLLYLPGNIEKVGYLYLSVFFMGYLYLLLQPLQQGNGVNSSEKKFIKYMFVGVIILSPLIFGKVIDALIRNSMVNLGVYVEKTDILVDKDIALGIDSLLKKSGVEFERQEECKEKMFPYYNVRILFTGIGSKTLIEFGKEKKLRIPLDSNKIYYSEGTK